MSDLTAVEKRALAAQSLQAFPVNLYEIREVVKNLLGEIQRYGFFNEYTNHNFDHVLGMLETAEWIITDKTKKILSPADWLIITLGIYFHDMGLLISRSEFDDRAANSDYQRFLSNIPAGKINQADYLSKINEMPAFDRDRVLYQEFVRHSHGLRVRSWIEGTALDDNNSSKSVRNIIKNLLGKLDPTIRRDLALLCESHTSEDISDTNKYKTSRPYGDSSEETVNLQYAAVLLRTVDLLQITKKRAPSALYQLINPVDPISQLEWQKQGAVRSVRKSPGRDREGRASELAPSDTIEVHARFEKSEGFFGLTSYISYARRELLKCQDALRKSTHELANPPDFPWKFIDDRGVEAEGFLTQAFGFEIDQQKILDLLTGHTLYNDTSVVIRELTQNSLDAVRLQCAINKKDSKDDGLIEIKWCSKDRTIEITDNGTGMSQSIIEKHLLKVGSSRYQDEKFRDDFPDFSSISRFGIGVLSAFMVADSVEITTCHTDDEKARQISLRSVHGKYLIKLLDKLSDRPEIAVYPHGTRIRLALRPSAEMTDILSTAKSWFLFPRCIISVTIDENEPEIIGYESPKMALEYYLKNNPTYLRYRSPEIQVREVSDGDITLAYAVEKDDLFGLWEFITADEHRGFMPSQEDYNLSATCVEGVAVEFSTPGYKDNTIVAVANAVGKNAPKTNVARSALEDTPESRDMLQKIYNIYANHISAEIERLSRERDYSLSRAVAQVPFMITPLSAESLQISRAHLMDKSLQKIPLIIIEQGDERRNISVYDLMSMPSFWTVSSPLTSSVEYFVREAPKNISASAILEKLADSESRLPGDVTVCNFSILGLFDDILERKFEPQEIVVNEKIRRVSVRWNKISVSQRWLNSTVLFKDFAIQDKHTWAGLMNPNTEFYRLSGSRTSIMIPISDVQTLGMSNYSGAIFNKTVILNPEDAFSKFISKIWATSDLRKSVIISCYVTLWEVARSVKSFRENINVESLDKLISSNSLDRIRTYIQKEDFVEAFRLSNDKVFDPFAWNRRPNDEELIPF